MRRKLIAFLSAASSLLAFAANPAAAASSTHYFYDAAGRFIGLTTNPTSVKSENFDGADNRTAWFGSDFVPLTSLQQLTTYQVLTQGDALISAGGQYTAVLQEDGNFVIYKGSQPTWGTQTYLKNSGWLDMLASGDLVLYDIQGAILWHSCTSGNPGASVVMQGDGNLVIYTTANKPIWASQSSPSGQQC